MSGLTPVRRIVTGHDGAGRSVVIEDAPATNLVRNPVRADRGLINLWATGAQAGCGDPDPMAGAPHGLNPPPGGTVFRFFQIPPGGDPEEVRAGFAAMQGAHNQVDTRRDPSMHRTSSVDYIVCLEGEIVMLLDEGEVTMRPHDVLIQRGTNHGWVNRGGETALMMAVLVDAKN
ncbi:MAG: Cupin 2 conserved barrel domain protein [Caulobacteraceae bacterium]|nr:Cupin 2 conserved barrel domain protein [Caulobacteraceae bacterium]